MLKIMVVILLCLRTNSQFSISKMNVNAYYRLRVRYQRRNWTYIQNENLRKLKDRGAELKFKNYSKKSEYVY